MKFTLRLLLAITILVSTASCGRRWQGAAEGNTDTLYAPEFASGFMITGRGGGSVLSVSNPWQGAQDVKMEFFLAPKGVKAPDGFAGTVVPVPLKRVVCMSSTYIAFLDALDETGVVKGVSGIKFISNEKVRAGYAEGDIRDVGYDTNLNYELIASLNPDLVMIYGIAGENSALTGKLAEMGVKTMYIGDYTEESPLGKAEWLVAFGELMGKREQAVEKFEAIRNDYVNLRDIVAGASAIQHFDGTPAYEKPVVMLNAPWRDTWFVPGDRSYMVRLITDAGARYACEGEDSDISRPVSSEAAFVYANRSDVWLNPGQASSLGELKSDNPRFVKIPPVVSSRVYNCNKRRTPDGGSDFWESGAVRPDIVLRDLVSILTPHVLPGHELYYYEKLE